MLSRYAFVMTRLLSLLAALTLAAPAFGQSLPPDPEAATGRAEKRVLLAEREMVVAAHPLAAEAGALMLRAGGTAVDAAIAVQAALGLVEPQSSGLGGGAFLLYWEPATKRLESWDGRETAPLAATESLFLDPAGKPMDFWDAVVGGRSVGVPGVLRMLEAVHRRDGRIAWADLFAPAIRLAEEGFPVSGRMHRLSKADPYLKTRPEAAAYFLDAQGQAWPEGHILTNPAYADTLRRIAAEGADGFYRGPMSHAIAAAVRGDPVNPGVMTQGDIEAYRALQRPAVCLPYRGYSICGMGPPSSGGVTVGTILAQLDRVDLGALGPQNRLSWHWLAESERLAFLDRARWIADRDFFPVPMAGLTDPAYLAARSALMRPDAALVDARAGTPPGAIAPVQEAGSPEAPSTTHLSIVDAQGRAVSMTSSIEGAFGSRVFVGGFLLNNQLTDFAFNARQGNAKAANRVEPGKRPRSSMAPTLIFAPDGRLAYVLGSPGGSRIIPFVAQTAIGLIDWGWTPQQAVSRGHVMNRGGATELEEGTEATRLAPRLAALGHKVRGAAMASGLHVIAVLPDGRLLSGVDPRRDGAVAGR